uniref:Ubiquitin-like domain-containing protein n=1 Tax=Parascaris univalens TaxID=6257 RepID=A0A914ZS54_PARUN
MGEEETNCETVKLLIRCAMQSFEDTPITCPIDWTVRQLKEKLADVCSSKPEACRQRLIYAGHCLQDDRTLRSVFENRPMDSDVRVIHLVCPPRDIAEFDGIRRRNIKKEEGTHKSVSSPPAAASNSTWQSYSPAYGTFSVPPYTNSNAQLQSAYNAYMMSYTNYMQQMIVAMGGNAALANGQSFIMSQAPFPTAAPVTQHAQPPAAVAADMVAAPAAGGIIQEAVAGDVDAPQRDFLDIVYKAIRMCFLIMLVYVYSSAERFLGVLFFIIVVWFVQARRDRNNRQRADRELAHAVNNVRQAQQQIQRQDTDSDTGSSDSEVGVSESNANADENREPTAWTIFWSTCYTFITSFFTSLIPDNPVPVNVN